MIEHPEPYRSRLIAAGKNGNSVEVAFITYELRNAHPERFVPEFCRDCASGYLDKTDTALLNCVKKQETKRHDERVQCADFSMRKESRK